MDDISQGKMANKEMKYQCQNCGKEIITTYFNRKINKWECLDCHLESNPSGIKKLVEEIGKVGDSEAH